MTPAARRFAWVPRVQGGVELLPVADVKGRPLFCTQGCDLGR